MKSKNVSVIGGIRRRLTSKLTRNSTDLDSEAPVITFLSDRTQTIGL